MPGRSAPEWRRSALVAALLLVAVAVRWRTFGNPVVGFDEQFYLVVGDRMVHGDLPFVTIFDRKPIGLFLIYAGARLLGGEGTIEAQMVALGFVWATALLIWRFARRSGGEFGGLAAAIAYLVWLVFVEGEGGQAPVFFNLPMVAAALLVERAWRRGNEGVAVATASGVAAMLLVGIAIQIKYTALFEGIFFGLALLQASRQAGAAPARLAGQATAWVAAALAPTALAWGWYAAIGHGREYLFANFVSMWGKHGDRWQVSVEGLAAILGIMSPFFLMAFWPRRFPSPAAPSPPTARFARGWFVAALLGMLAMRSFPTPQYAAPMLVPAVIASAERLRDSRGWRIAAVAGLLVAALIGQLVLAKLERNKGGAREAAAVAAAARPTHGGCLYVYDGYPALYRLTQSCLPTRFIFPGHLNMANEDSAAALGVDPEAEEARILAARPETIVLDDRPFEEGNLKTYAMVRATLARDYHLVLAERTGKRYRLVYRRNGM
ncbi:hypothetical protein ABDK56_10175 [Sphingomonas sp. ASV193]|uniref:ArnT family glycosyltransferase n=1 Tax=Sphingomonas sp. ASV193 TaxID=3144405 RepID=UPI0032E86933